jgi:hypothetical protein
LHPKAWLPALSVWEPKERLKFYGAKKKTRRRKMPFVERVIPVLTVQNLKKSLTFYTGLLGFELEWGGEDVNFPRFCAV